jgi:tetratricopeptide (TPR) repeat protein
MRPCFTLFIAVLLLFPSCKEKEQPVTKDDALAYAKKIDSAVANKDISFFATFINEEAFAKKIKAQGDMGSLSGLKEGLHKGLQNSELGKQIINNTRSEEGKYELVKHYEKGGKHHLIYRLYGGGLNYHDYELIKENDRVSVADIFIYASGENFSKSMADFIVNMTREGASVKDVQSMPAITALVNQGKFEEAKRKFDELPEVVKNQKLTQIYYVTLCAQLPDQGEYEKVVRKFEFRFRHEPAMHLMLIDAYVFRKEYDRALLAVNRIDSMIDKDPFLDYYRYIFYFNMDKKQEALAALEKLYKAMPEYGKGVLELIVNYLLARDFDKARPLVTYYRSKEDFDQDALEENLRASPDFKMED